jgi:hypothetical protein
LLALKIHEFVLVAILKVFSTGTNVGVGVMKLLGRVEREEGGGG